MEKVRRFLKRGQAKRTSLKRKHEQGRRLNNSPGGSGESWFHSTSGQTRNRKGGWKTKDPLIRQSEVSQSASQGMQRCLREKWDMGKRQADLILFYKHWMHVIYHDVLKLCSTPKISSFEQSKTYKSSHLNILI